MSTIIAVIVGLVLIFTGQYFLARCICVMASDSKSTDGDEATDRTHEPAS